MKTGRFPPQNHDNIRYIMLITALNSLKKAHGFVACLRACRLVSGVLRSGVHPPPWIINPTRPFSARIEGEFMPRTWFSSSSMVLFMALLLLDGCGPGTAFDGRHYDCTQADKDGIRDRIRAGWSIHEAQIIYCKEVFPPCADSAGEK